MVATRLALLLAAFGTLAHGLKFFQESAAGALSSALEEEASKSTTGEAPSKEHKRKRRLGALGASATWVKAHKESHDYGKTLYEFYQSAQFNHNMSQQSARHKEKMQAKAEELIALREERIQMAGKHAIFNKELAEKRKNRGDTNKTGLWIITDEPETKEDRHRRKFQRELRKQFPSEYNVTRFLEAAKQDAQMEELYAVREQYALEQAKQAHRDFKAAKEERQESAQYLQNTVAAAKGKVAAATQRLRPKKGKASGAPGAKEAAKADGEEEEEEDED